MLSKKLVDELNSQINYEFYSAHIYIAMEAYCASQDLGGFANFFNVQELEEKFHAKKFFDYVNQMNERVLLTGMQDPQNEFPTILDLFKKAYAHEKTVTARIYHLMDTATEEKEHATISLLKWFIDEQVEEENNFNTIIKKLERIGNDVNALYMLDTELAARVFTPPVTTA